MIKFAIFDYDGTVMKTERPYYRATARVFRRCGLTPVPFQIFRNEITAGVHGFYERYGLVKRLGWEKIDAVREAYLARHWDEIVPNRGLEETLHLYDSFGLPVIILSSNEKPTIERKLKEHGLFFYFERIISTLDKESALRHIIRQTGFRPREILYVDDASEGISTANKFGLVTVAFTGGFNTKDKLLRAKPNFPVMGDDGKFPDIDDFWNMNEVLHSHD